MEKIFYGVVGMGEWKSVGKGRKKSRGRNGIERWEIEKAIG